MGRNSGRFWEKITATLFVKIFFLLVTYQANATTDWELAKEEDKIKVYTREVDGWELEEFKVIAIFNVKRLYIYNAIIDVAKYPTWYPDIVESRICKKISETEFYGYSKIDLPWPTSDRDGECHFKVTHNGDEKTTTITMKASNQFVSVKEDVVRMTKGEGFWKLTSKENGATVVHYQYKSDPGGSIPSWLSNMFLVDNPFETVKSLRNLVKG